MCYAESATLSKYRYTGQREYSYINLYWYGSRWYDDSLGRFIQPDAIIPGVGEGSNPNAVGCLGASNYSPLTVDYHENQLLVQLNLENRSRLQDPAFKLPPVPTNPIAFDRYAYSLNNPIRYTDPTGHCPFCAAIAITLGAITPVGWVAIGVTAVGVGLYFTVPGLREATTNGIYQAGEAASNGLNALFARPKSNQAQNRQFDGAVKELQRQLGRVLSPDEVRELHEALHDAEDPGFWDIVEEGLNLFDKGENEEEESGDD